MKRLSILVLFSLSLLLAMGANDINPYPVYGDIDGNNRVNIDDVTGLINYLLSGKPAEPVALHSPNMTIAEFKAKHWQDARNYVDTVFENEVIHGWVTSTDEPGNIYKTLYITDESGAGLAISVNKNSLFNYYAIGREIVLPLQGYYVGKFNGMQQLGFPQWYAAGNTWEVTFMPWDMMRLLAEPNGFPDPDCDAVQPVDVKLADFVNDFGMDAQLHYQGKLVRISNVLFDDADGISTLAQNYATSRTVTDDEGNSLIVRTSNYADFASMVLPVEIVDLVGILSMSGTTWQLQLRSADDVIGTGVMPTPDPEPDPVLSLNEGFDSELPSGWKNVAVSGDKKWYQTIFQQDGYAAMTGYRGTQPPFDAWLITPALDIQNATNKVLTFTSQLAAYNSTTTVLEVYVLNSADPTTATVKEKLNPVLATPSSTSTYSEKVGSGDIDLSQWADGVYYIGFRYYAAQDVNYATWCIDNVKFGVE